MLHNLEAELAREGIHKIQIAQLLHISKRALYDKVSGRTKFTTDQAILIQKTYFPDKSIEYLFETKENQNGDKGDQ